MQQVDKLTFYHIHPIGGKHDALWMPGNNFSVGNNLEKNEFLKYFNTARIGIHYEDGFTIPMSAAIRDFLKLPIDIQHKNYQTCLQQAAKAIKEMGTYIRESIFEEVRVTEFPSHPSRMKCIWVCEEKDIQYWLDKLHAGEKKIFKVSLIGQMHRANPENLISDSVEHDLLRKHARMYWKADDLDNSSVHEVLFIGNISVREEIRY